MAARAAAALPSRSANAASSMRRAIAAANRRRRRLADQAGLAVADELRRAAAVDARDDRLARRERLDRDEAVVFVERRKADGAAAREVIEQRLDRRSCRARVTRSDSAERRDQLVPDRRRLSPSPAITSRV